MVKKSLLGAGLLALGSWLVGVGLAPAPALAGKSCNYLNHNLFMAQGYQNPNGVWVSDGWWVIAPGDCVVYSDQAFTFFKIREGRIPNRQAIAAIEGSESMELCQVNDRFTLFQAQDSSVCADAGGNKGMFINPGPNLELIQSSVP